jgi:hypothetical protein
MIVLVLHWSSDTAGVGIAFFCVVDVFARFSPPMPVCQAQNAMGWMLAT